MPHNRREYADVFTAYEASQPYAVPLVPLDPRGEWHETTAPPIRVSTRKGLVEVEPGMYRSTDGRRDDMGATVGLLLTVGAGVAFWSGIVAGLVSLVGRWK